MIKSFTEYLKLTTLLIRQNFRAALEYRLSFTLQVVGMILNNLCWLYLWHMFFTRFENVRGWTMKDAALMLALSCFVFGLFMFFCFGLYNLAGRIYRGELDYYLSLPRNPLWHVSFSRIDLPALGDIIFGVAVFIYYWRPGPLGFLAFICSGVLGAIVLYGTVAVTQSLGFYISNFEGPAQNWFWAILHFGMYPRRVYAGILRLVSSTIIPALFIYFLPIDIVSAPRWQDWLSLILAASFAIYFAAAMFRHGVRRYESGSMMQLRVQ